MDTGTEFSVSSRQNVEILNNIPFNPDEPGIATRLRFHGDMNQPEETVQKLLAAILPVIRPKAMYKVSQVRREPDSLTIDGIKFTSPLLRVNLEKAQRAFLYVVTCGKEVESFEVSNSDESLRYALDIILKSALNEAETYLQNYLIQKYSLDIVWSIIPRRYASLAV